MHRREYRHNGLTIEELVALVQRVMRTTVAPPAKNVAAQPTLNNSKGPDLGSSREEVRAWLKASPSGDLSPGPLQQRRPQSFW